MLAGSTHGFKVNFCKFTNETRLAIEDASAHSGLTFIAAVNGICAGGGYELALACDEILLVDDGNSAVSLPETALLAVLPGTGGLTRVVDKRRVRRDLADVFATLGEGVKGKRALEWRLVDALSPASRFTAAVAERAMTPNRYSRPTLAPLSMPKKESARSPKSPCPSDRWKRCVSRKELRSLGTRRVVGSVITVKSGWETLMSRSGSSSAAGLGAGSCADAMLASDRHRVKNRLARRQLIEDLRPARPRRACRACCRGRHRSTRST